MQQITQRARQHQAVVSSQDKEENQDKEESYEVLKAENSNLKNWIKDKDAQLKEKDTQIRQLLDIIQNNSIHE